MQYIILGITALILIVNVLVGLSRGFSRGLLRLLTLVGAAVGAFYIAKKGAASMAEFLVPKLEQSVASNPEFAAFLEKTPVVGQSVGALAQMLVAPLLFLVCYILLKMLTMVVYWIFCIFIKKPKIFLFRWVGGAVMGLLAGVIGVLVFVTPVMGYTQLFSRTVSEAESLDNAAGALELGDYNEKYLAPASTAPLAAPIYDLLGDKLFKGLTTVAWEGGEMSLETEWFMVVDLADHAASLGETPVAEYGDAQSEAVHAMAKDVEDSQMLSAIGGGALNGIANSWLAGESFMGIAKPATGDESVDIILNGFLRVFAITDPDLIGEDLECFADIFDLFIKYEMFAKIGAGVSTDDLVIHLAQSGFLTEARLLLAQNERMEPVTVAISDAGMRLLVRELGDPATYLEQHKELIDDMSNVLKGAVNEEGQIDTAVLTTELQTVLAEKQIEVPESATQIIAEGLADEFTGEELNTLTTEEITNRLIDRFATVENIEAMVSAQSAEAGN
ncbi:MAG: CvpA family protein [Clostridia bacterium]|nr:CvpA family protein [Clostridia bacterium]